jgi:protein O-mannosyl-transferase
MNNPELITTASTKRGYRLLLVLAGLVPMLLFWPTIRADFLQWDDDINIYRNPHLVGLNAASLRWALTDVAYVRRYMPLGWIGWLCNYELDGLNPATYHLGNVLLHCLNSMLVFVLIVELLGAGREDRTATDRWMTLPAGWVGALFWAVHPLRVEPVAWASGRLYCQAALFLLVSVVAYLRQARAQASGRPRGAGYWLAVFSFAASLLTYPIGLGLIPVLVFLDYYPLRRLPDSLSAWWRPETRRVWFEKIPFVGVAGLVVFLTFLARLQFKNHWRPPPTLAEFGLVSRTMQAFYMWTRYLWKTWAPFNLSPHYTTLIKFDPFAPPFVLSLSCIVLGSLVLVLGIRRWKAVATMWLAHLALLVPFLGLTEHPYEPSDRYSYVPGIVWSILLAAFLCRGFVTTWKRSVLLAASLVLTVVFSEMSAGQISVWKNSETLFRHTIAVLENDPFRFDTYHRLGDYYMGKGAYADAEESFRNELAIKPHVPRGLYNLGISLAFQKKFEEALSVFLRLEEVMPDFRQLQLNLGHTFLELDQVDKALNHYAAAVRDNPEDVSSRLALGRALIRQGDVTNAIEQFALARKLDPDWGMTYSDLAEAYKRQGRYREAIQALQDGLHRQPSSSPLKLDLAWLLATCQNGGTRNPARAVQLASEVVDKEGERNFRALDVMAAAYAGAGRFEEARVAAEKAVQLAPSQEARRRVGQRLSVYRSGQPFVESIYEGERPP